MVSYSFSVFYDYLSCCLQWERVYVLCFFAIMKRLSFFLCTILGCILLVGCIHTKVTLKWNSDVSTVASLPHFTWYQYDASNKLFSKRIYNGENLSDVYLYGKNQFVRQMFSWAALLSFSWNILLYRDMNITLPKELIWWAYRISYSWTNERNTILRFANVYEPLIDKVHEQNKVIYIWTNNFYKEIDDWCIPKVNNNSVGERSASHTYTRSFITDGQSIYQTLSYYDDSLAQERVGELCREKNHTLYKIAIMWYSKEEIENILHIAHPN